MKKNKIFATNKHHLSNLSENTIKKVTLQFLKTYYKYRPRNSDAKGKLDLVSAGGVVADGQLTFQDTDNQQFTASFEATSHETRSEVYYQKQSKLLWYDSFALSGLLATFLLSMSYRFEFLTLQQVGWPGMAAKFVVAFLLSALLYRLLAGGLRRYRYIHAVEQFKQFYANEQWIAVGEDVFENPTDKFYLELKNQCVNYGFGLIEIKKDLTPHLIITPAREEVFKSKRKLFPFMEKMNFPSMNLGSRYKKMWDSFYKSVPKTDVTGIWRFRKTFWKQWSVIASALFIIGFIYYKEYQKEPIAYVDTVDFEKELLDKRVNEPPTLEPLEFEVDSIHGIEPQKDAAPYLHLVEKGPSKTVADSKTDIYLTTGGKKVKYDCARFSNLRGEKYMLLESDFSSFEEAENRLNQLQKSGMEAGVVWSGCFKELKSRYLVYLLLFYESKIEAERDAEATSRMLGQKNLLNEPVIVLPLRVK